MAAPRLLSTSHVLTNLVASDDQTPATASSNAARKRAGASSMIQ